MMKIKIWVTKDHDGFQMHEEKPIYIPERDLFYKGWYLADNHSQESGFVIHDSLGRRLLKGVRYGPKAIRQITIEVNDA